MKYFKMKHGYLLLAALLISLFIFSGCSTRQNGNSADSSNSIPQPELIEIVQKVKEVYGEDYIPSTPIEEQQLSDVYSINLDNIEDVIAEGPMISAHVDTFLAIKAKAGKGADVEKELQAYQNMVVENSMQYPSNIAKVQTAQVVRHGDYVFYVLLGAFDERMDVTEEDSVQFAKEQVQKGVDAISSFFE